jgi:TonB family protein
MKQGGETMQAAGFFSAVFCAVLFSGGIADKTYAGAETATPVDSTVEQGKTNQKKAGADDQWVLSRYKMAYESYVQLVGQNNFQAALPYAKEAYELGKWVYGTNTENFAGLTYNYGLTLLEVNLVEKAYPILRQALDQYEKLFGERAFTLGSLLKHTGRAAAANGHTTRAVAYFNRGLNIVADHEGKQSLPFAALALQAGTALLKNGSDEAVRYLLQSHGIYEKLLGHEDSNTALAAFQLGEFYLTRRQYSAAIGHLESALPVFEATESYDKQRALRTHINLVSANENLGRSDAATKHCLAIGANMPEVHEKGFQPLFQRPPVYPEPALRARREGYVLVRFDVDARGFVRNLEAVEVEGDKAFVQPALAAARRYRFAPRFVNGKATVAEDVQVRVSFRLQDAVMNENE